MTADKRGTSRFPRNARRTPLQPLVDQRSHRPQLVLVYTAQRVYLQARRELRQGTAPLRTEVLPCVVNPARGRLRWTLPCARALALTGAGSGLLSGLLGVGGGFVIVPALTRYTDLDTKSIVVTSLAVIALVSAGSVASAALVGAMPWSIGAPFVGGAALGLLAGWQFAVRLAGAAGVRTGQPARGGSADRSRARPARLNRPPILCLTAPR